MRDYLNYAGSICLLGLLLLGNSLLFDVAQSSDDDEAETTELVVKLNPVGGSSIDAINAQYGTSTLEILLGSMGIYRLQVPSTALAADVAKEMEDDARLLYAEPNYSSEAPEGNPVHIGGWGGADEATAPGQYAIELLDIPSAHEFRQGSGVTVALLDTGVQFDHPDLAHTWTAARYDFVDDDADPTDVADGTDNDGDGFVDETFGHGTHIAGIITLVAPQAQIMPLRVLNSDGYGNIFVIAEAVQYAIEHGADVINLSLGSAEESDLLEDLLKEAVEGQDVVVVAAAGNLGNRSEQFPASEDEIIGVTAINAQNQKPSFANYGDWVDLSAPGEAILSAFPVSRQASWSGTSMAVPFVSGQAALIRSAVPAMSAIEIAAYIRLSARSIDEQNPGLQGELGSGRIEIGASIQAICEDDGTCQAPDLTGQIILESRAIVEGQPANGLTGSWVIGGDTFIADSTTEFEQEDGPLQVGTCVDVMYRNTLPLTALEIRSREQDKCTVEPAPTLTSTATPVIAATPSSTPGPAPTSTPRPTVAVVTTLTASPAATSNPSGTAMATQSPGLTQTSPTSTSPTSTSTGASATSTPEFTPTSTPQTSTGANNENDLFLPIVSR